MKMLKLIWVAFVISLAVHGKSLSVAQEENDASFPSTLADCPEEDQVTYTAAALEFEPTRDWTNAASGEDILRANVESIYEFIKIAKEYGTDIFVSPEYGLQSVDMYTNDSLRFQSLTQQVPDPALAVTPCDDTEQLQNYDIIKNLSCIAREQEMYLVVDVAEQTACNTSVAPCQTDDLSFFNTQVVFDRTGQVIARYRKQNLYLEPQFAPGPADDSTAIFTTDFGVKFSLQVCFDITFSHPGYSNVMNEGVRDIVMSTAWVDVNPFLLGISVQNGWSRGLGVNLIVAGYHFPEKTKLGSGVFRGYSDLTSSYTFDPNSGNVVVIQPVTTCRSAPASRTPLQKLSEARFINVAQTGPSEAKERVHVIVHEDLSVYERVSLPTTEAGESKVLTQCSNDGLCCRIEYEHSSSNLTYQLLTYSGIVKKVGDVYQFYEQVCAVVWCASDDWRTCARNELFSSPDDTFGPFTLEGSYSCETVYPVALRRDSNMIPNADYQVTVNGSSYSLTSEGTHNTKSVALFGRWYARDQEV